MRIHDDPLQAHLLMAKIIAKYFQLLHELWLKCCEIIHMQMADGIEIEERVELLQELWQITPSEHYLHSINAILNKP